MPYLISFLAVGVFILLFFLSVPSIRRRVAGSGTIPGWWCWRRRSSHSHSVMEAVGAEEELAAVSLGANGWQMFCHITVPNIKWGLAYGIILCNACAMGEFGAVSVVSGHIVGTTDTMPLRIEKLFQEYNLPGSFARFVDIEDLMAPAL